MAVYILRPNPGNNRAEGASSLVCVFLVSGFNFLRNSFMESFARVHAVSGGMSERSLGVHEGSDEDSDQ